MRLLNANTLELAEFDGTAVPPYAILSHTWGEEEVSFLQIQSPDERAKRNGFAKVLGCCRQARMDAIDWVWIDTCCIDKSSSAELSEAINSMFVYYRDAEICYAFLQDVPAPDSDFPLKQFRAARWFTRGWCLQELIAPNNVEFYAADWTEIGTKRSLHNLIEEITAVPKQVLISGEPELGRCTIAQKMSWASGRQTTRVEDEAYCLLGIFGVNMPMLYGEGHRAFYRLQEEIIKRTEDYTFLLWTPPEPEDGSPRYYCSWPVFAPSPSYFHRDGPLDSEGNRLSYKHIQRCSPTDLPMMSVISTPCHPPHMTSRGLRISLPSAFEDPRSAEPHLTRILWCACTYRGEFYVCMMIHLVTLPGNASPHYVRGLPDEWALQDLGRFCLFSQSSMARFHPAEIYLCAVAGSNLPPGTRCHRPGERAGRDSRGMMEVIVTSCNDSTSITPISKPDCLLEDVTERVRSRRALPKFTRVWHSPANPITHNSIVFSELPEIAFEIVSRDYTSATDMSRQQKFQAHLRVQFLRDETGYWTLVLDGDTRAPVEPTQLLYSHWPRDRARVVLQNGMIISAGIKRVSHQGAHAELRCVLRICVTRGTLNSPGSLLSALDEPHSARDGHLAVTEDEYDNKKVSDDGDG